MAVMTVDEALGLAREHIQAGRMVEGEGVCRAILEGRPRRPRRIACWACSPARPGSWRWPSRTCGRRSSAGTTSPRPIWPSA